MEGKSIHRSQYTNSETEGNKICCIKTEQVLFGYNTESFVFPNNPDSLDHRAITPYGLDWRE